MRNGRSSTWLLASLCVALFGCATAAPQPPSVDVTGNWAGEWIAGGTFGSGSVAMTLQQTGASVTGDLIFGGAPLTGGSFSGPVSGTVSGNEFSLSYRGGSGTGHFTVNGNQMTGSTAYSRWSLKRQ